MKVGFVTEYDLSNPRLRSGVPYHIARAMDKNGIGFKEIKVTDQRTVWERLQSRYKQWYYNNIAQSAGRYDIHFSLAKSKSYRKTIHQHLPEVDVLFTINPMLVAAVETKHPIIIWIDNSFRSFHDYYLGSSFCKEVEQDALATEKLAFDKAAVIYTASEWLRQRLVVEYPSLKSKFSVMPRGANMNRPPLVTLEAAIQNKLTTNSLQLLFVCSGTWERKGGDLVLEIVAQISKQVEVTLTIIGTVDASHLHKLKNSNIRYLAAIDKQDNAAINRYDMELLNAHFLIVPSKADGFGIVYAEAASFGVPSIAFGLMGITEAIKQNVTGFCLEQTADAKVFADTIINLWQTKEKYHEMCLSAYQYASANFDWATNVNNIFKSASR